MASYKLALFCLVALAVAQVMCEGETVGSAANNSSSLLHKIGGTIEKVMSKIPIVGSHFESEKKDEAAPAENKEGAKEKKEEGEEKKEEGEAKAEGEAKEGDAKEGEKAEEGEAKEGEEAKGEENKEEEKKEK